MASLQYTQLREIDLGNKPIDVIDLVYGESFTLNEFFLSDTGLKVVSISRNVITLNGPSTGLLVGNYVGFFTNDLQVEDSAVYQITALSGNTVTIGVNIDGRVAYQYTNSNLFASTNLTGAYLDWEFRQYTTSGITQNKDTGEITSLGTLTPVSGGSVINASANASISSIANGVVNLLVDSTIFPNIPMLADNPAGITPIIYLGNLEIEYSATSKDIIRQAVLVRSDLVTQPTS